MTLRSAVVRLLHVTWPITHAQCNIAMRPAASFLAFSLEGGRPSCKLDFCIGGRPKKLLIPARQNGLLSCSRVLCCCRCSCTVLCYRALVSGDLAVRQLANCKLQTVSFFLSVDITTVYLDSTPTAFPQRWRCCVKLPARLWMMTSRQHTTPALTFIAHTHPSTEGNQRHLMRYASTISQR